MTAGTVQEWRIPHNQARYHTLMIFGREGSGVLVWDIICSMKDDDL